MSRGRPSHHSGKFSGSCSRSSNGKDALYDDIAHDACAGADAVEDVGIEDLIELFDGNLHPPEYYRQAEKEFNEDEYSNEGYSEGSLILLEGIEYQWHQFCGAVLVRDPQECFENISISTLKSFFDWCLNQKLGKKGRRKRGVKTKSALGTNWKLFRLVYERATGAKLDGRINRSMHKVLRFLATKHGLSSKKRVNRCMTIDNLKEQIEETLSTTKKSFHIGELRILAVLFLLLLAPAGSRPASILKLRYGDIRVVLAKDPEGGPHNILIRFTLEFTKTYLGDKDAKTFTIPERIFDESLLLNMHVFLLGILFRHNAFQAPSLVSPQQLGVFDIHPGERELPLPLKDDLHDVPIFRRAVKTLVGYEMSPTEPIPYGTMAGWVRRIGELLGLEYTTIPYNLRYNAANELDNNPSISEALRNLALGHANSDPFQKHYLGREVCADVWAVVRGEKQQQALLKQACSVGHSISKRRPVDLTPEQAASVNTHPWIRKLTADLRKLQQGSEEYRQGLLKIRSAKQSLRRALMRRIREKWTNAQAVDDIERQLQGRGFAEAIVIGKSNPQQPAQRRLMKAVLTPASNSLEGQCRRRNNAIDAIVDYCTVMEGQGAHQVTRQPAVTSVDSTTKSIDRSQKSFLMQAFMSVFRMKGKERPRRCFMCVGAALNIPEPEASELTREFYNSSIHNGNPEWTDIAAFTVLSWSGCRLLHSKNPYISNAYQTSLGGSEQPPKFPGFICAANKTG
ncbi:hypothetical protein JX266_014251 [Neoarthrinium moseri]|nr:hypothetical protein JX266_014251 [Neoarthrinium moseri]